MTKVTQLNVDEKNARRRIHLREISGDSETALDTVGQELRAARLRRGDDLATVSRSLKIRKDHLEAVEEDRLESLPGKTYAIGFVRSYAGYLGLDATDVVERYKQEISGRHDGHSPTMPPMPDEPRRLPHGWRIVAGIVVLAVGYGLYHLLFAGSAPQTVPPPPAIAPAKVVAVAPKRVAPPPAAPVQQTAVPSPAANDAASKVPPAPPAEKLSAAPTAPSATPSPALSGAAATVAPEAGTIYGKTNRNPRVVLKAKGDTHILVRDGTGTVYINRNLKAGDSYQLPNAVGLTLSTSNAGAIEVDLDGQAMGTAGGDQQSAGDVPLDPQTIADRFSH
jgi:cytoskeleton protein RodZ